MRLVSSVSTFLKKKKKKKKKKVRPSSGCPPPCRNQRPSVRNSGCNSRGSRCPRPARRSDSSSLTNGGTRHSWSNVCATRGSSRSSAPQRTLGSRNARTRCRLSVSGPPEALRRCWNDRRRSQCKLHATVSHLNWNSFFFFFSKQCRDSRVQIFWGSFNPLALWQLVCGPQRATEPLTFSFWTGRCEGYI